MFPVCVEEAGHVVSQHTALPVEPVVVIVLLLCLPVFRFLTTAKNVVSGDSKKIKSKVKILMRDEKHRLIVISLL